MLVTHRSAVVSTSWDLLDSTLLQKQHFWSQLSYRNQHSGLNSPTKTTLLVSTHLQKTTFWTQLSYKNNTSDLNSPTKINANIYYTTMQHILENSTWNNFHLLPFFVVECVYHNVILHPTIRYLELRSELNQMSAIQVAPSGECSQGKGRYGAVCRGSPVWSIPERLELKFHKVSK